MIVANSLALFFDDVPASFCDDVDLVPPYHVDVRFADVEVVVAILDSDEGVGGVQSMR